MMVVRHSFWLAAAVLIARGGSWSLADEPAGHALDLKLRQRVEFAESPGVYQVVEKSESWKPKATAIIVCDMWDLHHSLNATMRLEEMAPQLEQFLKAARSRHDHHSRTEQLHAGLQGPPRAAARPNTPRSRHLPQSIGSWCYQIPAEENGKYPIDQVKGENDDDPRSQEQWLATLAAKGRNPAHPWLTESSLLTIDPAADYISDHGEEVWSILEDRGIDHVILTGVHTNMCVLGRPFGLRQMAKNGKSVALCRDLTDTIYNPQRAPYVSHFAGTALIVEHIEKYVCPTITSDQVSGGAPFQFAGEKRSNDLK